MASANKQPEGGETELNPEQLSAVRAPHAPLLIVAGAGTGKTKTLTGRIIRFLRDGVPPERICAVTFTNKAAREMADRIAGHAPGAGSFIGTFHSLGARLLRSEARLLGRTPDFAIFDESDSLSLARKIVKSMALKKSDPGPAQLLHSASDIKNSAAELRKEPRTREENVLGEFYERYEERLKANNAFDFDDLIAKLVFLLKEHPALLTKYRKRFSHIFIDEYQDLNDKQYELVKLLAAGAASLTAVGDDAQMIYGWRGSNIQTFLNFKNDWPETRIVFLEENYRSTKNILRAATAVIGNNTYQPEEWKTKKLWTRNDDGVPVLIAEMENAESEASWIAEGASAAPGERTRTVSETAILYRTNAQSRALEQALIERDIPYRIFGGLKFYERKEIKDVVAGVRYAVNPEDEVSRDRLEKTLKKRGFLEYREAVESPGRETLPPAELISFFLSRSEYRLYLKKNFANVQEREENIAALIEFASSFRTAQEFLEQIALLQAQDAVKKDTAPSVTLTTIHLAKGLEFDRVYIAGCNEGLMPHARSLSTKAELEEERRLMYVAMTRARKELIIAFYDIPSRFLSELPGDACTIIPATENGLRSLDDEERYITLD